MSRQTGAGPCGVTVQRRSSSKLCTWCSPFTKATGIAWAIRRSRL